jgi:HlyD family secretion protein
MNRLLVTACAAVIGLTVGACSKNHTSDTMASGYVEATTVRVASKVAGRLEKVNAVEGARMESGAVVATIATTDVDFALQRAKSERDQANAQLQLLLAGTRPEDIRQGEANLAGAQSNVIAAQADLESAKADEVRFQMLVDKNAGSTKQRDDAVTRRQLAEAKLRAANDQLAASKATLDRLKAGARPEEISAARARVQTVTAQIDALEHDRSETTVIAPSAGIVGSRLVEPGEIVAVGTPLALLIDLDNAWANAYVQEPLVPSLKIDQPATVITDAGDRLQGRITFISPKAEFTPRNVQTPDERAKLVYRVKVSVDNRNGVLKPGMPVTVDLSQGAK